MADPYHADRVAALALHWHRPRPPRAPAAHPSVPGCASSKTLAPLIGAALPHQLPAGAGMLGRTSPARRCGSPTKQTFRAEVLVDVRPVDAKPGSRELPIVPLLRCCVEQPRKPGQWDRDRPAVGEVSAQRVVGNVDVPDSLARTRCRSTHSMPPAIEVDSA